VADDRPNILWICTDQQRYDTIAALGNQHVSTPHVDRLVNGGVAFTRAYCQSPICTPSRASFLTGMYPSAVHVNGNGNGRFPVGAPKLVTRMLADSGYRCGLIGKLHLASAFGRVEPRVDDGYSYWQYSHAPRDDWDHGHDYADWVRAQGGDLNAFNAGSDGVPADLHQTTWCAGKAIEFMCEGSPSPWLASVNIYDPHPPFNPPKAYRDLFDPANMPGPLFRDSDLEQQHKLVGIDFQSKGRHPDQLDISSPIISQGPLGDPGLPTRGATDACSLQAAYYAMIKLIDDRVGDMLAALDESGQLENTIVLFTSDHGETLGDHGLIQKGCRFYEGLVRVPLVFSCPERFRGGRRSDALVELLDIAPTLLQLAGLEVPGHMQGRSLLPVLDESVSAESGTGREFVRCEFYDALQAPDGTFATMYRDQRYKLVVYHGHNLGELYDLEEDPEEFENMWDELEAQSLKLELVQRSFDASMLAADRGCERIGPM